MRLPFLSVVLFFFLECLAQSSTFYATRYNNFSQLNHNNIAEVNGDFLQYNNTSNKLVILSDTTKIDPFNSYKYYIKFANKHNKEGKSYKVKDGNKTISIPSTKCGIVFNQNKNNYWIITASCHNSDLYNESTDNRFMTIELANVQNGATKIVEKINIDKDVNLDDSFNYLGVQVEDSIVKVLIGKDKLQEVITHTMTQDEVVMRNGCDAVNVGCAVGPGAQIAIERAVLSTATQSNTPNLNTPWTREVLDRHFAASKNPYEGYWIFLDRDMEDNWLKLGGRYTIALVENEHGYDVIYVDGAQVKKSIWHTGMKKGVMTETIFTDNFNGIWYDATMEPIDQDVFVTFESGVILNFKFPVYNSQIRFSKVIDTDLPNNNDNTNLH